MFISKYKQTLFICMQDVGDKHEVAEQPETPGMAQSSAAETSYLSRNIVAEGDREHDEHMVSYNCRAPLLLSQVYATCT